MSAKKAKAARKLLNKEHFPSQQETCPAYKFGEQEYTIEVDHYRRIRRIARSQRITIPQAIDTYRLRTGLPRPYAK